MPKYDKNKIETKKCNISSFISSHPYTRLKLYNMNIIHASIDNIVYGQGVEQIHLREK